MEKLTEQAFKKKIRNFITLNSVTKDEIRQEFNEIFDKLKEFENADVVPRSEIEKAKQEVVSEIFEQFESHISTGIRILKDCINDADTDQIKKHLLGRLHELCGMEKFIAELKKKYMGE